jgi:hypothetical protein
MFKIYWIEQFTVPLNTQPSADPQRKTTDVGQKVSIAIQSLLKGETK